MDEDQAVIVAFDIAEVAKNRDGMLGLFNEMDDGLNMPSDFKMEAAKVLLNRVLANEEIHLLEMEAEFLKEKAPSTIVSVTYYDSQNSSST